MPAIAFRFTEEDHSNLITRFLGDMETVLGYMTTIAPLPRVLVVRVKGNRVLGLPNDDYRMLTRDTFLRWMPMDDGMLECYSRFNGTLRGEIGVSHERGYIVYRIIRAT